MKWAKVKQPDNQNSKEDAICFDEFPDQETLQRIMEDPQNAWTDYTFKPMTDFESAGSFAEFQNRYENFCGGYLLFYDDVVRNKAVDHTIHFKWGDGKDEKGQYSVKVFLSPAPVPVMSNSVKSAGQLASDGKSTFTTKSMATDGGSVDPPPPPPPPPPKMH